MFKPKERKIYKFHNGVKEIAKDPITLARRLDATRPSNYKELLEGMVSKDSVKYSQSMDVLTPWVEKLFDVKAIDEEGNGLDEDQIWSIFFDFMEFVTKKKESTGEPQSSSPFIPVSTISEEVNLPTKDTSDCGCGETTPPT